MGREGGRIKVQGGSSKAPSRFAFYFFFFFKPLSSGKAETANKAETATGVKQWQLSALLQTR